MHFNENGQAVAAGAAFCFAGLLFLIDSIRQFRQKGQVLDPVVMALEKEDRERLRTPRAYRETASFLFLCALVCLLTGLALAFDSSGLALSASVTAVAAALYLLLKRVAQV